MSKIKDLPKLERPREKASLYGIKSLSDIELLAVLISSGYQGYNATELSANILNSSNGLLGLSSKTIEELKKYKGIKTKKALLLASVFEIHYRLNKKESEMIESPVTNYSLYLKYKSELISSSQEQLILIVVNTKHRSIFETCLYKGTNINISIKNADILKEIIKHNGRSFYLIHNHPSGDINPSLDDIEITSKLMRDARKFNIKLLDHIIVGESDFTSIVNILKA